MTEEVQSWQSKYENLQKRLETDTKQTRDEATKELEALAKQAEERRQECIKLEELRAIAAQDLEDEKARLRSQETQWQIKQQQLEAKLSAEQNL